MASAANNTIARASSLIAVAVLPAAAGWAELHTSILPGSRPGSAVRPSSARARAWRTVCLRRLPYATPARQQGRQRGSCCTAPCMLRRRARPSPGPGENSPVSRNYPA
jgi:hypothetical protein